LKFLVRKGTVSQAAEKYPNDVILKPDAFCRAEEPAFVFSTDTKQQVLRSAQDDIYNNFSAATSTVPPM